LSEEEEDFEFADEGAKNEDMVEKVLMKCKVCGSRVRYRISKSCPYCGYIVISCPKCGYEYEFGE